MYISAHEAADRVGLTQGRIAQLAAKGKLDGYKQQNMWYVSAEQVEILRQEQTYWPRKQVCQTLNITQREFERLVQKGFIEPVNQVSEHHLFDPAAITFCYWQVVLSYSKDQVAAILGCSMSTVHRLIKSGRLEEIETAHGLRVPFENLAMYFVA